MQENRRRVDEERQELQLSLIHILQLINAVEGLELDAGALVKLFKGQDAVYFGKPLQNIRISRAFPSTHGRWTMCC